MGTIALIVAALMAGKAIGAIAAGLTIAQWVEVGQVAVGAVQIETQLARVILAHRPRNLPIARAIVTPDPTPRLCFQGAPSGQSARVCFE